MKKNYPLIDVERIKQKRLEEAEKQLRKAREILAREEKQLEKDKKVLDDLLAKKKEIIEEYFAKFETEKMTVEKIEATLNYIKNIIEEKIQNAKQAYDNQKEKVKKARIALDEARHNHYIKNQDMEKIRLHYKEWLKQEHIEEIRGEANLMDELGSSMYSTKKDRNQ